MNKNLKQRGGGEREKIISLFVDKSFMIVKSKDKLKKAKPLVKTKQKTKQKTM